jgi:hypothetical protein
MNTTETLVAISGNTYPVKEQLKALGARWNPDRKAWMVAPDKADQARQIVASAGPAAPRYPVRTRESFAAKSAWAQRYNGGVGFCGAPGCGRNGCRDCRD